MDTPTHIYIYIKPAAGLALTQFHNTYIDGKTRLTTIFFLELKLLSERESESTATNEDVHVAFNRFSVRSYNLDGQSGRRPPLCPNVYDGTSACLFLLSFCFGLQQQQQQKQPIFSSGMYRVAASDSPPLHMSVWLSQTDTEGRTIVVPLLLPAVKDT